MRDACFFLRGFFCATGSRLWVYSVDLWLWAVISRVLGGTR